MPIRIDKRLAALGGLASKENARIALQHVKIIGNPERLLMIASDGAMLFEVKKNFDGMDGLVSETSRTGGFNGFVSGDLLLEASKLVKGKDKSIVLDKNRDGTVFAEVSDLGRKKIIRDECSQTFNYPDAESVFPTDAPDVSVSIYPLKLVKLLQTILLMQGDRPYPVEINLYLRGDGTRPILLKTHTGIEDIRALLMPIKVKKGP